MLKDNLKLGSVVGIAAAVYTLLCVTMVFGAYCLLGLGLQHLLRELLDWNAGFWTCTVGLLISTAFVWVKGKA